MAVGGQPQKAQPEDAWESKYQGRQLRWNYISNTQLCIQAGGVDKTTVHFQRVNECTEGTYSPCCSWFRRGVGILYRGSPEAVALEEARSEI